MIARPRQSRASNCSAASARTNSRFVACISETRLRLRSEMQCSPYEPQANREVLACPPQIFAPEPRIEHNELKGSANEKIGSGLSPMGVTGSGSGGRERTIHGKFLSWIVRTCASIAQHSKTRARLSLEFLLRNFCLGLGWPSTCRAPIWRAPTSPRWAQRGGDPICLE